ncbi:hypothetical protein V3Q90_03890 [Flavobacterium oreochromis]|uniref:hypothetical protein n=2 Tax=Flavobacterium oreochromis TaxID=2906078 RepID=UPI00385B1329
MIKYLDYYIPKERISIEEIFTKVAESKKIPKAFTTANEAINFFKTSINLTEVAYADTMKEETMFDILLNNFFEKKIIDKQKIDLLILINDDLGRNQRMKNLGHYLIHKHELDNAEFLSISGNQCANTEFVVSYAEGLLQSGMVKNLIILAANKIIDIGERTVGTYAIHGDGAGIIYMNTDEKEGFTIVAKHSYTNGLLYNADQDTNNSLLLCKNYLKCISECIAIHQLVPEDYMYVNIQNANPILVTQCLSSLGFKESQFFKENIYKYGHLDCVDFIINLKTIAEKMLPQASKIFSFATGSSGSNICLLLEVK